MLRGKTVRHKVLGATHVIGLLAAIVLAVIYNWPGSGDLVSYFTLRPAWVWFAATLPLAAAGVFALKPRWLVPALLVWTAALFSSEEMTALVRFAPSAAREQFAGLRAARNSAPDEHLAALRIVTWNILATPGDLDRALAQVAAYDPDVIFLQETCLGEMFPDALRRQPHLASYHLVRAMDNAILSRFPISPAEVPITPREGHAATLTLPGDVPLLLVNLHLQMPALVTQLTPDHATIAVSRGNLAGLRRLMSELGSGRMIVAGDFNTPGNYWLLRHTMSGFRDAFLAAGRGWGKTIPAAVPMSRVDLIYVPRDVRVVDCRVFPTEWSDHRPVVADVIIPK